jgi:ankyrin repeat protein
MKKPIYSIISNSAVIFVIGMLITTIGACDGQQQNFLPEERENEEEEYYGYLPSDSEEGESDTHQLAVYILDPGKKKKRYTNLHAAAEKGDIDSVRNILSRLESGQSHELYNIKQELKAYDSDAEVDDLEDLQNIDVEDVNGFTPL